MEEIKEKTIAIICDSIGGIQLEPAQLDDNLSELGMDSFAFIRLVVTLEDTFFIEIPDSKLLIAEMNTANKIFQVVYTEIYNKSQH